MRITLLKYLTPFLQPIYRQYFSRARRFRYGSIRIVVYPGVFYPGFIFSTKILLNYIGKIDLKGKRILDMGAGSGIIALMAAVKGAKATATDINPEAIVNVRENAKLNNLNINVIESNLFTNVPIEDYDYIFINPPYYQKDPNGFPEMAWYCGSNHEYFKDLFIQLKEFSKESCKVVMILSESCNLRVIKDLAEEQEFIFSLVEQQKRFGEVYYIYHIYSQEIGSR